MHRILAAISSRSRVSSICTIFTILTVSTLTSCLVIFLSEVWLRPPPGAIFSPMTGHHSHTPCPHSPGIPEMCHFNAWQNARLRQEIFCRDVHPLLQAGVSSMKATVIPGVPLLYLHEKSDIVSSAVWQGSAWEYEEMEQILWAMQYQVPGQQQKQKLASSREELRLGGSLKEEDALEAKVSETERSGGLFVDVGANIGWFAVNMAARGYNVAAFEGMRLNQNIIRSTLCENPGISRLVTLFPFGLGNESKACFIVSGNDNVGDGIADCTAKSASRVIPPPGYSLRGTMRVERLDEVLDEDIKVLKVDVEGNEPFVFEGTQKLLQRHRRVWFVVAEYGSDMLRYNPRLRGRKPVEFVVSIVRMGFRLSASASFKGSYRDLSTEQQVADLELYLEGKLINLFFAHDSLFNSQSRSSSVSPLGDISKPGPMLLTGGRENEAAAGSGDGSSYVAAPGATIGMTPGGVKGNKSDDNTVEDDGVVLLEEYLDRTLL